jgi:hypothetical protein
MGAFRLRDAENQRNTTPTEPVIHDEEGMATHGFESVSAFEGWVLDEAVFKSTNSKFSAG